MAARKRTTSENINVGAVVLCTIEMFLKYNCTSSKQSQKYFQMGFCALKILHGVLNDVITSFWPTFWHAFYFRHGWWLSHMFLDCYFYSKMNLTICSKTYQKFAKIRYLEHCQKRKPISKNRWIHGGNMDQLEYKTEKTFDKYTV